MNATITMTTTDDRTITLSDGTRLALRIPRADRPAELIQDDSDGDYYGYDNKGRLFRVDRAARGAAHGAALEARLGGRPTWDLTDEEFRATIRAARMDADRVDAWVPYRTPGVALVVLPAGLGHEGARWLTTVPGRLDEWAKGQLQHERCIVALQPISINTDRSARLLREMDRAEQEEEIYALSVDDWTIEILSSGLIGWGYDYAIRAYGPNGASADYLANLADADYLADLADADYLANLADADYLADLADADYFADLADADYFADLADADYLADLADLADQADQDEDPPPPSWGRLTNQRTEKRP